MEEIIYRSLARLFNAYQQYGNFNDEEMFKILAVIVIREMMLHDNNMFLMSKDIREIEKALYKLLGESCQLPLTIQEFNCC